MTTLQNRILELQEELLQRGLSEWTVGDLRSVDPCFYSKNVFRALKGLQKYGFIEPCGSRIVPETGLPVKVWRFI